VAHGDKMRLVEMERLEVCQAPVRLAELRIELDAFTVGGDRPLGLTGSLRCMPRLSQIGACAG
jgi:hypothetical protein